MTAVFHSSLERRMLGVFSQVFVSLTTCVGQVICLFVPSSLVNGHDYSDTYHLGLLWEINELICKTVHVLDSAGYY